MPPGAHSYGRPRGPALEEQPDAALESAVGPDEWQTFEQMLRWVQDNIADMGEARIHSVIELYRPGRISVIAGCQGTRPELRRSLHEPVRNEVDAWKKPLSPPL